MNILKSFCFAVGLVGFATVGAAAFGDFKNPLGPLMDSQAKPPTPSPLETLAKEDVSKGRKTGGIIGAITGAAAGVAIANNTGGDKKDKVLAGAAGGVVGYAVGAKLGEMYGTTVADRRLKYGREHEFLEAEIKAADTAITVRERKMIEADKESQRRQAEITRIEGLETRTRKDIVQAKAELKKLDKAVAENNALLEEYQNGLNYIDYSLSTSAASANATKQERETWEQKKAGLLEQRGKLAQQYAQLQGVGTSLEAEKARWDQVIAKG